VAMLGLTLWGGKKGEINPAKSTEKTDNASDGIYVLMTVMC
jgi:hypothetical protein